MTDSSQAAPNVRINRHGSISINQGPLVQPPAPLVSVPNPSPASMPLPSMSSSSIGAPAQVNSLSAAEVNALQSELADVIGDMRGSSSSTSLPDSLVSGLEAAVRNYSSAPVVQAMSSYGAYNALSSISLAATAAMPPPRRPPLHSPSLRRARFYQPTNVRSHLASSVPPSSSYSHHHSLPAPLSPPPRLPASSSLPSYVTPPTARGVGGSTIMPVPIIPIGTGGVDVGMHNRLAEKTLSEGDLMRRLQSANTNLTVLKSRLQDRERAQRMLFRAHTDALATTEGLRGQVATASHALSDQLRQSMSVGYDVTELSSVMEEKNQALARLRSKLDQSLVKLTSVEQEMETMGVECESLHGDLKTYLRQQAVNDARLRREKNLAIYEKKSAGAAETSLREQLQSAAVRSQVVSNDCETASSRVRELSKAMRAASLRSTELKRLAEKKLREHDDEINAARRQLTQKEDSEFRLVQDIHRAEERAGVLGAQLVAKSEQTYNLVATAKAAHAGTLDLFQQYKETEAQEASLQRRLNATNAEGASLGQQLSENEVEKKKLADKLYSEVHDVEVQKTKLAESSRAELENVRKIEQQDLQSRLLSGKLGAQQQEELEVDLKVSSTSKRIADLQLQYDTTTREWEQGKAVAANEKTERIKVAAKLKDHKDAFEGQQHDTRVKLQELRRQIDDTSESSEMKERDLSLKQEEVADRAATLAREQGESERATQLMEYRISEMEGVGGAIRIESEAKARELLEFNTIVAKLKDHVAAVGSQVDAKVQHITKKREFLGERMIELAQQEAALQTKSTEQSEKSAMLATDNMTIATLSARADESTKMCAQEKRQLVGLNRDVKNLTSQVDEEKKKETLRVDEISKTRTAVATSKDRISTVQADNAALEEARAEQDELEANGLATLAKREQAVAMKRAETKTMKRDLHDLGQQVAMVEAAIVETRTSMASVQAYITAEIESKDSQLMRLAAAKEELVQFNNEWKMKLSQFQQAFAAALDAYAGQVRETEAAHVHQQTLLKQKGELIAMFADKIAEAQAVIERLKIAIAEEAARKEQLDTVLAKATQLKAIRISEVEDLGDTNRSMSILQDKRLADNAVINAKVQGAAERNTLLCVFFSLSLSIYRVRYARTLLSPVSPPPTSSLTPPPPPPPPPPRAAWRPYKLPTRS